MNPSLVRAACPRCGSGLLRDGSDLLCCACGHRHENMSRVAAFVLAGGQGTRLEVLSHNRAKPALPFGPRARLIDFTLDNCANSGLTSTTVLAQHEWGSVRRAVSSAAARWAGQLHIEVRVSAEARGEGTGSYLGTADAVRQNLDAIPRHVDTVLVLAGDHVYSMDYGPLIASHRARHADVTLGVAPVSPEQSSRFGMVHLGPDGRVSGFEEKPERSQAELASMGIYAFRASTLRRILEEDAGDPSAARDFGYDVIPGMIERAGVYAHRFDGYWRDVGTVETYWAASMDLVVPKSGAAPPARTGAGGRASDGRITFGDRASARNAILGAACHLDGVLERSVVAAGVRIAEGAIVRDSVVLAGASIGKGAIVERAIVDEGARIGAGARVGVPGRHRTDGAGSEGITVIGRNAEVAPGVVVPCSSVVAPDARAVKPSPARAATAAPSRRVPALARMPAVA